MFLNSRKKIKSTPPQPRSALEPTDNGWTFKKLLDEQPNFRGNIEHLCHIKKIAYLAGEEREKYLEKWNKWARNRTEEIDLQGAYLAEGNLQGINLCFSDLRGIDLYGASLIGANLFQANLSNAILEMSNLEDAELLQTNLNGASLRKSRNYILSDNSIERTKFSPNSADPYSVLRRNYTGFRFTIILLLTLCALSPFIFDSLLWLTVNNVQFQINKFDTKFENVLSDIQKESPLTNLQLDRLKKFSKNLNPYTSSSYKKSRIIYEIFGWCGGFVQVILTLVLLVYNTGRGIVTIRVNGLREEETMSAQVPLGKDYLYLFRYHRMLQVLFILTCIIFAIRISNFLWMPVFIPSS